jgi:HK97 family phage prohead protease
MDMSKKPGLEEVAVRSFEIPDIRAIQLAGENNENTGNVIEGHPAVYDKRTPIGPADDPWFYEIIERGAFNETNFDDVLFSANHQWYNKIPLARSRRNNKNSTMQLTIDDIGLFIRANLDLERNAEAKSLYSAVERGDIQGMSFIFYVKEEKWENLDKDVPTRRVQKISKVREVSAVNYPAYDATDINARSDQLALENAKQALENARSTLENEKNEMEQRRNRIQTLGKMTKNLLEG